MNNHQHIPAKTQNFSLAFQQMCSVVAIGQTKNQDETLRELILQILVLFPDEKIANVNDIVNLLNSVFGLQFAEHEINYAIERLKTENVLLINGDNKYLLDDSLKSAIKKNIEEAIALEESIRNEWNEELKTKHPLLDFTNSWTSLRNYLSQAFLRHGIQAVALLDPSLELDGVYSQSLSELLNLAVKDIPTEYKQETKQVISSFVATAGQYPDRSKYIAQLADGAFSYFSLATDPQVADRLRQSLSSLILFLDTNFLFGILGLTTNPQVAASNELMRVIKNYNFPFTLKYHPKTKRELIHAIGNYEDKLSQRIWTKSISRAAIASKSVSGVEIKYHQEFVENGIDVKSFFLPFHHIDILLKDKFIEEDEASSADEKDTAVIAKMIAEYEDFLTSRKRTKPEKLIDHDMTVLAKVRKMRTNSTSTIDAGTLLMTCDYSVFSFDWETSRRQRIKPCTVLPNLFWQILHPFIPADEKFYQSFAQTFAIPEFRTLGSGAAEACSKMINLMAGLKNFSEETAIRLLSNDVLIEQLQKTENDDEFQKYVELAIVNDNAQLSEENLVLSQKIEHEQIERSKTDQKLIEMEKRIKNIDESLTKEQQ
ncbi:MAG: hypothetical protein ACYDH1_21050, partial [Anaerolineaceae bacterium]